MTRHAEHTPTGYEDAASVVVNQAPAPSSLAGGEVTKLRALLERHQEERRMVRMKDTGAVYDTTLDLDTKLALAALSPEAPAREGVDAVLASRVAATMAALTPRHEAPAEGAGGLGSPSQWCGFLPEPSGPAEGAGERLEIDGERLLDNIACATQNRTLLRGDPREDKVLIEAILLNVEQEIDLALCARSSAPEAREGEACSNGHQPGCDCDVAEEDVARSKPAPAAPSADKLRVAVEALERIAHEPRPVTRAAMREYAAEALAALKAEGC